MVCSAMIDRWVCIIHFGFTDWGDLLGFSYIASRRLKQKLQAYSVPFLFIKGVSPLNFHECRDVCNLVQ
jgi:hypothetical protein